MSSRKANGTDKGMISPLRSRFVRTAALCCCGAALFFLGIYTAEFLSRRNNPPGPADPFSLVDSRKATTALPLPPQAADPPPGLSFFDTLAGKEPAEELLIVPDPKPGEHPVSPAQPAAPQPAAGPAPEPPTDGPEAVYTIQLGSFGNDQAARDFSVRLAEKGYEPYIQMIEIPDRGLVYRVRMGRLHSLEEAQHMAKSFERTEKMSVLITTR